MTRKEKERDIYVRVSNHARDVCLDFSTGYKEINGSQYVFEIIEVKILVTVTLNVNTLILVIRCV